MTLKVSYLEIITRSKSVLTAVGSRNDTDRLITTDAASCRRTGIQKLGHSRNKLGGGERLRQHDAVRNALGGPVLGAVAAHIDHWKSRIDFSGVAGNVPTVQLVAAKIDIGYERTVFPICAVKQCDSLLA